MHKAIDVIRVLLMVGCAIMALSFFNKADIEAEGFASQYVLVSVMWLLGAVVIDRIGEALKGVIDE